jgi:hypothetical protein
MHAHLAEVMAEARFHKGTRGRVERLSRRVQHFMHNGRSRARTGAGIQALQFVFLFLLALVALALQPLVLFFVAVSAGTLYLLLLGT